MKKLTIYFLVTSFLSLQSCGDFLDSEPLTVATETNFYKTPDDAYKALVGCYDGLQRVWADGISFPIASEVFSDNAYGGTGNADNFNYQAIDEFDKNRSTNQNLFQWNWTAYYHAVFRCNTLLANIDQVDWSGKEDLRTTYEAEARFIRAYLYFDMVRLWENIPLLTEPTSENLPQAAPGDVYKVIAEDLKFAADNLEAVAYTAQPAATYGRVTKWAAESLLARVFLFYTGYYGEADLAGVVDQAQALAYLEDVISNSGHGLVDDFAHLWPAASVADYAGEDNKETVFAIKYTYTSDYDGNTDGNHWMILLGMREQFSYPYGNGWGGGTVSRELWNAYDEEDTRRTATIIAIDEEDIAFENQSRQREYTGYYNKKYSPLVDEEGNSIAVNNGAVNFMIGQFQDYVSIRYADVLLMAAELGSANAQVYFDDVRERAYQENFTPLTANRENIMTERRLEFALEGLWYWDLLRQGIEVAAAEIAETTQVLNGGAPVTKEIVEERILETRGFQQIPYTQITLSNSVLTQNSGW